MKKVLGFIITVLLCASAGSVFAAEQLFSPDKSILAQISFDNGNITYNVSKNKEDVIVNSSLGINFSNVDFTNGVSLVSRQDNVIDETYTMISGKASQYENKANEAVFTLSKDGETLDLYVRAYNDGVAIRYGYNKDTQAIGEATSYSFTNMSADVWAMEYERCYENFYPKNTLNGLNGTYGMPMTVRAFNDTYVLLTEADLNGSYSGSVIEAHSGQPLLVKYEPKQTEPVNITAPFLSPWRIAVIGSLSDISKTQMCENLCAPSKISDTSWIKPGISSWTWFNGDPTGDPEVYKQYIDFSAEMGWQYVLLDEGWQPGSVDEQGRKTYSGIADWTQDVINYASERGIGVIVWSTYWDLDTPEKRTRLKEWADMGIKGVKVDFFDNETQSMLKLYDAITEETAQLHLLVNYHGCHKPTGERRTWPHLLTREAVYGTEHFKSGEGWGPTAEHNCTLPFTRNAVGPMDYTPAVSDYFDKNYFTDGQRAALPIIFESGIQCLSDKPENYRNSALYDFLKNFPAAWDKTKLLSGEIGQSVVMMRQKGDIYYIGSICNEQKTQDICFDFLEDGKNYTLTLYCDGENGIVTYTESIKKNDIITVPQQYHGGAAMKVTPYYEGIRDLSGHWSEELVRTLFNNNKLNGYFGINFKPDDKITRGEFVIMLDTAFGVNVSIKTPKFTDSINNRAKNYIAAAVDNGIINGVSETEFRPDEYITREQAATIIGRYLDLSGGIKLNFLDSADISDYAKMYVSVCAEKGIITGYEDGSFLPKNNITRAETAAILTRCLK